MSRVGKKVITIPAGVTVTVHGAEAAEYDLYSGGKMIVVED